MHIANNLSRCRHVCRGRNSINEFSTLYVIHKWIHTSIICMLTTVRPCVAVNNGVVTLEPRYIFAVSKHNILKHGGLGHRLSFSLEGLFSYFCTYAFMFTTIL